jgi:hypothetical protein
MGKVLALFLKVRELCPLRYPLEVVGYLALMSELSAAVAGSVWIFYEVTSKLYEGLVLQ